MPTLMIHHRRRLILKKLTHYAKVQRSRMYEQEVMKLMGLPVQHQEEEDQEQFNYPSIMDAPLQRLPFMNKSQRAQFRLDYPNLPPYLSMDDKQKRKFFKDRSEGYNNKILQMPQRVSKTKKIVKFSNNFDVRPFRENQMVVKISNTKSFKDSYHPQHFS